MTIYASKAEADDTWANGAYIPNADRFIEDWANAAQGFRDGLTAQARAQLGVPYGPSDRQAYDLFLPKGAVQGVLVFIHGGYWIRFDRSYWSHFAAGALPHGWAVAIPSYDLCPNVTIPDITMQITRMIETVSAQIPEIPLAITGHSAGGHLAARMLEQGRFSPEIAQRIRAGAPISPVADLRPLLETSMNDELRLTEATALSESPLLGGNSLEIPIFVRVGANERPVFVEQAKSLANHWNCCTDIVPDTHHFDVIDDLKDPDSGLIAHLLGL